MKLFLKFFKTILLFLMVFSVHASTSVEITIDRSGVFLHGKFFLPEGTRAFPTVILLHGFPGNETDVLGIGNKLSQAGFCVLTFNYSGTYKSEGLNSFENTQKDIKAAYDFIHDPENTLMYKIDTSRIYLGGYSYGGGMAMTYASNHPEITSVFSIAGTDHGEFFREYMRNPEFKRMIDSMFEQLAAPSGPVRFPEGGMPKDVTEQTIAEADSTIDLRRGASLLAPKNILLIGGWNDVNVTIDHHILPLYRAIRNANGDYIKIVAFEDDHTFRKHRSEVAQTIIDWLNKGVTK